MSGDGFTPGPWSPDVDPGVPVYVIAVYLNNREPPDDGTVMSVLGGPAPDGWACVPEDQHPKLARAVARHVTDYAAHLVAEADLVDAVDTLDVDGIIAEHHHRTRKEEA